MNSATDQTISASGSQAMGSPSQRGRLLGVARIPHSYLLASADSQQGLEDGRQAQSVSEKGEAWDLRCPGWPRRNRLLELQRAAVTLRVIHSKRADIRGSKAHANDRDSRCENTPIELVARVRFRCRTSLPFHRIRIETLRFSTEARFLSMQLAWTPFVEHSTHNHPPSLGKLMGLRGEGGRASNLATAATSVLPTAQTRQEKDTHTKSPTTQRAPGTVVDASPSGKEGCGDVALQSVLDTSLAKRALLKLCVFAETANGSVALGAAIVDLASLLNERQDANQPNKQDNWRYGPTRIRPSGEHVRSPFRELIRDKDTDGSVQDLAAVEKTDDRWSAEIQLSASVLDIVWVKLACMDLPALQHRDIHLVGGLGVTARGSGLLGLPGEGEGEPELGHVVAVFHRRTCLCQTDPAVVTTTGRQLLLNPQFDRPLRFAVGPQTPRLHFCVFSSSQWTHWDHTGNSDPLTQCRAFCQVPLRLLVHDLKQTHSFVLRGVDAKFERLLQQRKSRLLITCSRNRVEAVLPPSPNSPARSRSGTPRERNHRRTRWHRTRSHTSLSSIPRHHSKTHSLPHIDLLESLTATDQLPSLRGWVHKLKRHGTHNTRVWKRRWFALHTGLLCYWKTRAFADTLHPKASLQVNSCVVHVENDVVGLSPTGQNTFWLKFAPDLLAQWVWALWRHGAQLSATWNAAGTVRHDHALAMKEAHAKQLF